MRMSLGGLVEGRNSHGNIRTFRFSSIDHKMGFDLAEQADRPFGDFGHFMEGEIFLAAKGPDLFPEAVIVNDRESEPPFEFQSHLFQYLSIEKYVKK